MVLFEHLISRAAHRRYVRCVWRRREQRQRPQRHHVHVPDQEVLRESRQRARGAQLQKLQVRITPGAVSSPESRRRRFQQRRCSSCSSRGRPAQPFGAASAQQVLALHSKVHS